MISLLLVLSSSRIHRRHHRYEPNSIGDSIVKYARSKVGSTCKELSTGPDWYDWSGLAQWCHNQVGISIPASAGLQASHGERVPLDSLQPGDLIIFQNSKLWYQVGIYSGNNMMIYASEPNSIVRETPLKYLRLWGRRYW